MTQQYCFWVSTQEIWKHFFAKICVLLCSLQQYSWWPRHGDKVSFDRLLDKENVVHVYNGLLTQS